MIKGPMRLGNWVAVMVKPLPPPWPAPTVSPMEVLVVVPKPDGVVPMVLRTLTPAIGTAWMVAAGAAFRDWSTAKTE